ncbi:hypothetical protein, partial [Pseudonocardia sp. ICBG1293]
TRSKNIVYATLGLRLTTVEGGLTVSFSESAVLAHWKEHREQFRQSETQRATLTNVLFVITAALSAVIAQQKFSQSMIAICVFIIVLGLFGALAVSKYHERARYHLMQARALTAALSRNGLLTERAHLDDQRDRHYAEFPTISRVRLHRLWVSLHIVISAYGAALLVICLSNSS